MDRERILTRLAQLDQYLKDLHGIAPATFDEYRRVEKKRACERLAQIAVEAAFDTCALLVRELRLGLPGEEDDLLAKLLEGGFLSAETVGALRRMKGFRNILVHEYGTVDDRLVYDVVTQRMGDLERFAREVRALIREGGS